MAIQRAGRYCLPGAGRRCGELVDDHYCGCGLLRPDVFDKSLCVTQPAIQGGHFNFV